MPVTISIPTLEGLSAFVAGWHSFVGSYKMSHVIFETVKPSTTWHTSQIFRSHIGTIWNALNEKNVIPPEPKNLKFLLWSLKSEMRNTTMKTLQTQIRISKVVVYMKAHTIS